MTENGKNNEAAMEYANVAATLRERGFDVDMAMVEAFDKDGNLPESVIGPDYDEALEDAMLELLDIDTTPIDRPWKP